MFRHIVSVCIFVKGSAVTKSSVAVFVLSLLHFPWNIGKCVPSWLPSVLWKMLPGMLYWWSSLLSAPLSRCAVSTGMAMVDCLFYYFFIGLNKHLLFGSVTYTEVLKFLIKCRNHERRLGLHPCKSPATPCTPLLSLTLHPVSYTE